MLQASNEDAGYDGDTDEETDDFPADLDEEGDDNEDEDDGAGLTSEDQTVSSDTGEERQMAGKTDDEAGTEDAYRSDPHDEWGGVSDDHERGSADYKWEGFHDDELEHDTVHLNLMRTAKMGRDRSRQRPPCLGGHDATKVIGKKQTP